MAIANKNPAEKTFEIHLDIIQNDRTAIDLLAEQTLFSRQKIKQIMHQGAVWLTQNKTTKRIRRAKRNLTTGQVLHLYYDEKVLAQIPPEPQLVADEKDYSVWFKPAGMLSQGSKYGDHCVLYRWVETHLQPQRNAFIVHRLDKATSGLMLIAHSKTAAAVLSAMFRERSIDKYYKALVHNNLHPTAKIPIIIDQPLDEKQARTKVLHSHEIRDNNNNAYSLLDIQILTGRKHQIRQHLANINHPIVGDRLYGRGTEDGFKLGLTAYKIKFISPFDQQNKHYELNSQDYPTLKNTEQHLPLAAKNLNEELKNDNN